MTSIKTEAHSILKQRREQAHHLNELSISQSFYLILITHVLENSIFQTHEK